MHAAESSGEARRPEQFPGKNKMDAFYDQALEYMERTLEQLTRQAPPPQRVPMADSFAYRYVEQTTQQAIVQKLARIISGLHAARVLLKHGFLQEQAALQRMLDEFQEDVTFLTYAEIREDTADLLRDYLAAFYEEEFDVPQNPIKSTQKRPMIPRRRIHAYLARVTGTALDASTAAEVVRTLSKTYSGYVHGASPQIMEMYGGAPPTFHVAGMLDSPLFRDHKDDLWNYFYRCITAFAFAAKAFGDEVLFASIYAYSTWFAGTEPSRK
ncbi:hypothetical protein [Paraburkholderia sp. Cpub6]|uniref:hypothetical protein n=1 Tax=Paraburkholderia sp. Cpub6 TaxID=2723094 RepID=UPI00182405BA|nr:hypothetical protein [Paraburkholderia sp. Cpub6]MBB5463832.1 hypothetical protein [Paraburkholderia sp. Cpub6]